jgi:glycosyltransferase involved in cell wall biosynthesis
VNRKILIIVENMTVPFDTRVWKEAKSLRNAGYQVSVLCPRGKGFERGYEFLEGVHIYRHPVPPEGDSLFGYLWEYGSALILEFVYAWWIFLRRGFDIVQGCNPPDTIFLVALPFKLLGVRYIFDHHDANPELYLSKFQRDGLMYKAQVILEKLTFRASDVVMSTNMSYRDIAVRRGGRAPERVFVVRNGPDMLTFKPVPPNPALKYGKKFLVGYVGTMSVQEGLDILIEAAEHLKNSGRKDIHFTCVGGGPGLPTLQNMVKDRQLEDCFNFTRRVPDAQLLEILSTADVCVNPDRPCEMNDISTMIKIMEYMALGKPIVQFDLKEGRVSAGDASLYVANNEGAKGFGEKIAWILDHPENALQMGRFGRRRVEEELSWNFSETNLLKAYEKACSK